MESSNGGGADESAVYYQPYVPAVFLERRPIQPCDCLYEILEVPYGARNHEVKQSYTRLVRLWHHSRADPVYYDACVHRVGVYVEAHRMLCARTLHEVSVDRLKKRQSDTLTLQRRVQRDGLPWPERQGQTILLPVCEGCGAPAASPPALSPGASAFTPSPERQRRVLLLGSQPPPRRAHELMQVRRMLYVNHPIIIVQPVPEDEEEEEPGGKEEEPPAPDPPAPEEEEGETWNWSSQGEGARGSDNSAVRAGLLMMSDSDDSDDVWDLVVAATAKPAVEEEAGHSSSGDAPAPARIARPQWKRGPFCHLQTEDIVMSGDEWCHAEKLDLASVCSLLLAVVGQKRMCGEYCRVEEMVAGDFAVPPPPPRPWKSRRLASSPAAAAQAQTASTPSSAVAVEVSDDGAHEEEESPATAGEYETESEGEDCGGTPHQAAALHCSVAVAGIMDAGFCDFIAHVYTHRRLLQEGKRTAYDLFKVYQKWFRQNPRTGREELDSEAFTLALKLTPGLRTRRVGKRRQWHICDEGMLRQFIGVPV